MASDGLGHRKRPAAPKRPRHKLDRIAQQVGCRLISLGDIEQLAGVDIQSPTERQALWQPFRRLFQNSPQTAIDAVMDHCAAIALRRIGAGKLCLVKTVCA